MSFRISLYNVPTVRSYDDALALYTKAAEKPWNNSRIPSRARYFPAYYKDHALPGKRSRNCGVRMENENIIFRLHNTDVVTWRPDGSVRVVVYHSQSTCHFVNHFVWKFYLRLHGYEYSLLDAETGVATPIMDDFTIFADGTVGETTPATYVLRRVDKAAAKAVRERVGYPEFAKWRKIMEPLLSGPQTWRETHEAMWWINDRGIAASLSDKEMWPKFITARVSNSDILNELYAFYDEDNIHYLDYFDTVKFRENGVWRNISRYQILKTEG